MESVKAKFCLAAEAREVKTTVVNIKTIQILQEEIFFTTNLSPKLTYMKKACLSEGILPNYSNIYT
jgi:hypothetical protein